MIGCDQTELFVVTELIIGAILVFALGLTSITTIDSL